MNRSSLKVLEAIMLLADHRRPITVRAIRDMMGWHSTNHVQTCLRSLEKRGFISYEPKLAATIRPRCRFIPVECLE